MLFCSNVGFGTAFKKAMGPGISWNIWHNNKHDFQKVTLLETVHTTRLHRSCPAQCNARAIVKATFKLPKEFDINVFKDALESTAEWLGQIENPTIHLAPKDRLLWGSGSFTKLCGTEASFSDFPFQLLTPVLSTAPTGWGYEDRQELWRQIRWCSATSNRDKADPKPEFKKAGIVMCICNPSAGDLGIGQSLGLISKPASSTW